MKTVIIHSALLLLLTAQTKSQTIPNSGFENWTLDIWSNMNPDDWEHSNADFQGAKILSDYGIQGNLSLQAINWWWIGQNAFAKCKFTSTVHPGELSAYVKTTFDSVDTVNITVHIFYNGSLVDKGIWINTTASPIPGWSLVTIPISQMTSSIDSIEIQINGGMQPGTIFHVDGLSFNTTGINEQQHASIISIFPNPTISTCTITANSFTHSTLSLYDLTGIVLLQQSFNEQATVDVHALRPGMYVVEVRDKKGRSVKGKVVRE